MEIFMGNFFSKCQTLVNMYNFKSVLKKVLSRFLTAKIVCRISVGEFARDEKTRVGIFI
jgi:hypothetical protein